MRRAARVDENHAEIVQALRRVGCTVQSLADIGRGCPDLLVARQGQLWLMEVKDGRKPPSARTLTPDEARWHAGWHGPVFVVESVDAALSVIGAWRLAASTEDR
jgi:hypothetical protein